MGLAGLLLSLRLISILASHLIVSYINIWAIFRLQHLYNYFYHTIIITSVIHANWHKFKDLKLMHIADIKWQWMQFTAHVIQINWKNTGIAYITVDQITNNCTAEILSLIVVLSVCLHVIDWCMLVAAKSSFLDGHNVLNVYRWLCFNKNFYVFYENFFKWNRSMRLIFNLIPFWFWKPICLKLVLWC